MKMVKLILCALILCFLASQTLATTDKNDVIALQSLYKALKQSKQLMNWSRSDPCGEVWLGVSCFGTAVTKIELGGLGLVGSLGEDLHKLKSLKYMDLSSNKIGGAIPFSFPWNLTNLNLASNDLGKEIPQSFRHLKHLLHLNLSHNELEGPLGNVFKEVKSLEIMDLSFNRFSGSVTVLANLSSLTYLNIENNQFTGLVPKEFQKIPDLRFGGNDFDNAIDYSPPSLSPPPITTHSPPSHQPTKRQGPSTFVVVILIVGAAVIMVAFGIFAFFRFRERPRSWERLKKTNVVELTSLTLLVKVD